MDAYSPHWQSTLLGSAFWRGAEIYNTPINDAIEVESKKPLHKRFPFTLGSEEPSPQTMPAHKDTTKPNNTNKKESKTNHNRRFSMSDALSRPFQGTSPFHGSRRARSSVRTPSPDREPSIISEHSQPQSQTPSISRSRSLLRVSMNILRSLSGARKKVPQVPMISDDQATFANPLPEFRGGRTWDRLDRGRESLGLDLFWPIPVPFPGSSSALVPVLPPVPLSRPLSVTVSSDQPYSHSHPHYEVQVQDQVEPKKHQPEAQFQAEDEEESKETDLPIHELNPLPSFRNLHTLKLVGMTQSYQAQIWTTCWLNPALETLELGMALPPTLRPNGHYRWPCIRGGWELTKDNYRRPVYYGDGKGNLNPQVGLGAYLDKFAIEKAKVLAMASGRTRHRLSIRTLILSGFVVDGDPFWLWFDAQRL
ncbi:hypothetical protein BBP40_008028, partial [Aspergillus hancockii]